MLHVQIIALLFLSALASAEVLELNQQNFRSTISAHKHILIDFYSPTCGFCKVLDPEIVEIQKILSESGIPVAKLNCIANPEVAEKEGIESFPTVYFYSEGERIEYREEQKASAMGEWVKKYLSNRIKTIEESEVQNKEKPYLVYKGNSQQKIDVLNKASFLEEDMEYYQVAFDGEESLTIYLKDKEVKYEGEFEISQLKNWIRNTVEKTIIALNSQQKVQNLFFKAEVGTLLIIYSGTDREDEHIYRMIESYCEKNKKQFNCAQIQPKHQAYQGAHDFFRRDQNVTLIGFVKDHMRIAYAYEGLYNQLTERELLRFVGDALADRMKKVVMDGVPTEVVFDHVPILSNTSFEEMVQNNQYVFVQFFDSDNEDCKIFAPRLDAFVTEMKEEGYEIVTGALDCKQYPETCQDKLVKHYPTHRIYIHGLSVEYPREQQLPQMMSLISFATRRMSARTVVVTELSAIKKPCLVFFGSQMSEKILVFPKVFHKYPVYFLHVESDHVSLEFHIDEEVYQYTGTFTIREVELWVQSQKGPVLSNMLEEEPDARVIRAIKNRQPLIFLVDYEIQRSLKYRTVLGHIAHKLQFCAGYAETADPAFQAFLEWIGLPHDYVDRSFIVYSETITDKKYLYPDSLDDMTKQSIKAFMEDIRLGRVPAIGQQIKQLQEDIQQQQEQL